MDQRLFRELNFFDSAGATQLVGQTERQSAGKQAGRRQNIKSAPTAADSLAQPRGEQRLLGMPMCCPDSCLALVSLIG